MNKEQTGTRKIEGHSLVTLSQSLLLTLHYILHSTGIKYTYQRSVTIHTPFSAVENAVES